MWDGLSGRPGDDRDRRPMTIARALVARVQYVCGMGVLRAATEVVEAHSNVTGLLGDASCDYTLTRSHHEHQRTPYPACPFAPPHVVQRIARRAYGSQRRGCCEGLEHHVRGLSRSEESGTPSKLTRTRLLSRATIVRSLSCSTTAYVSSHNLRHARDSLVQLVGFAGFTVLVYDHLITFADEVRPSPISPTCPG